VLVAVYGTARQNALAHPAAGLTPVTAARHAFAHGVGSAFLLAAILDVACLLVVLLVIRIKPVQAAPVPAAPVPAGSVSGGKADS